MVGTFLIAWRAFVITGTLMTMWIAYRTVKNDTTDSKQFAKDNPAVFVFFIIGMGAFWLPLVIGYFIYKLFRLIGTHLTLNF